MYWSAQLPRIQYSAASTILGKLTHGCHTRSQHKFSLSYGAHTYPFERTKRSRLNHLEFLGFALMKLPLN